MSKLDDFLGLSDVSEIRKTISVNVNGKDLELIIRPLTEDEHNQFQRRSNSINKNKVSFDNTIRQNKVIIFSAIETDFIFVYAV